MKSISKLKDEARRQEQREEWEKAVETYLQVIRIGDEGDGEVELPLFNRIGDICVRLGRPLDAVRYYEEAADRYANDGLYNNAIALCNKALRYQPDHLELMRKLGQFSASQGFLTDARRYFLEYAERKFRAGETDAALSALADFAGVVDDGEIRELLGRRLHAHGRDADALRELTTAYEMHVHAGDQGRAEAVRATILAIDPQATFDGAAAAAAPPPAPASPEPPAAPAAPAAPADDLPHFEPLGVEHGARFTVLDDEEDEDDAAAPGPVEGLQSSGYAASPPPDEEVVDDLPYLDIDEPPASHYDAVVAAEPVPGLEPGTLDFDTATSGLEALDLGSDIERDEPDFAPTGNEREFLLDADDDHTAASQVSPADAGAEFDLPLLDDGPGGGFDLPYLTDDTDADDADTPLPLLEDPADTELPLLDDAPFAFLGDDDAAEPLPLLDDEPPGPADLPQPGAPHESRGPAAPAEPQAPLRRHVDLAAFEDEPPGLRQVTFDEPVFGEPPSPPPASHAPVVDEPPTLQAPVFEQPPAPADPVPPTPAEPPLSPYEPLEEDPFRLPDLSLPDFEFRGETSAEAAIFEVEQPGAPLFRPEDLTPFHSGEAVEDVPAEPAIDPGLPAPRAFDAPGWLDEIDTPDTAGTALPGFEDLEGRPQPFDYIPSEAEPEAEAEPAEPGSPPDADSAGLADALDDAFGVRAESHDDTAASGAHEGGVELEQPEWLSDDDAAWAAARDDDSGPVFGGFAFADDVEQAAPDDDGSILDVPAELDVAEQAGVELSQDAIATPWQEPDRVHGARLEADADVAAQTDAPVVEDGYGTSDGYDTAYDVAEGYDPAGEWTPERLLDPEPEAVPAEPAPGSGPAAHDVDEADEGFVDLGALIRAGEEEGTTRFYVQEVAPTGDEDRDFAELLSQFKAKISEHVPTEDAAAHYDLALAYKEMGLLDEAISEFQVALRAGRMRLKIYEELGECFLQKRQFNIAEKILSRALATNHDDELELLGVYYHLGRAYEEMGRTEQARDAYERVLGMDIGFQDVAERLGRL